MDSISRNTVMSILMFTWRAWSSAGIIVRCAAQKYWELEDGCVGLMAPSCSALCFCLTFLNGQLSILTTRNGLLLAISLTFIIFFSNMICFGESDNQAFFNCIRATRWGLLSSLLTKSSDFCNFCSLVISRLASISNRFKTDEVLAIHENVSFSILLYSFSWTAR